MLIKTRSPQATDPCSWCASPTCSHAAAWHRWAWFPVLSRVWNLHRLTACLDSGALPVSVYRFLGYLTLWPPFAPFNFPLHVSSHDSCVPGRGPPRLLIANPQGCALTNIKDETERCGEALNEPRSEWNNGTVTEEQHTARQHGRIIHTGKERGFLGGAEARGPPLTCLL